VIWRTVGERRRELPPVIRDILSDNEIVKVGQGISGDLQCLREDFADLKSSDDIRNLIDLYPIGSRLNCYPKSLQGMVGIFLRKRLLKDMRISNWEEETLRAEQIQYAALDAWASREVYMEMARRYDVKIIHEWGAVKRTSDDSRALITKRVQLVDFHPSKTVMTPPVYQAPSSSSGTVASLVQECVGRGYLLRLCGFEKIHNQYTCKFEVTIKDNEKIIATSNSFHASIRDAQIDAARVMLDKLASRLS
jgi:hypothetical protein